MKISAKGRYALAAMTEIARRANGGENISVINISGTLGISKIYLEQVLVQLKKAGLIFSVKGSKGGHQLALAPNEITAWDILVTVETSLVEKADSTVKDYSPDIEAALNDLIFRVLDNTVKNCLQQITIQNLLDYSARQNRELAYMLNL
jgi:Rrf2 family protein